MNHEYKQMTSPAPEEIMTSHESDTLAFDASNSVNLTKMKPSNAAAIPMLQVSVLNIASLILSARS